ncbi:MAG: hypothetical protein FWG10_01105 [Eubacteriaceae bacterium]|nr:hypothetical protein [Eubacteriaceae bacterium]
MKKNLAILLAILLLCLSATGCASSKQATAESKSQSVNAAVVDIDLTKLSDTMIYAEAYNIMLNPENYIGKKIKANGLYYAAYYEPTGLYYHYLIIGDSSGCCEQGFEFKLDESKAFPDDYPGEDSMIEIEGVFGVYFEDGDSPYYYLDVDGITVISEAL